MRRQAPDAGIGVGSQYHAAASTARLEASDMSARLRRVLMSPAVVLLVTVLIAVKLSYFNFPRGDEWVANEWYGWRLSEAASALAGSLASLSLFLALIINQPPKRRLAIVMVANVVLSLVVLADVVHFRHYGDIISVSALGGAWQVGLIISSVANILRSSDVLLFLDLVLVGAIYFVTRNADPGLESPSGRRWLWPAIAVGMALVLAIPPIRAVTRDESGVFRFRFFRFYEARKMGLANYHLFETSQQLWTGLMLHRGVSPAARDRATRFIDEWRPVATRPSEHFGTAAGRNLIVVMVESLQSFAIGLEVGGQMVTPNLTRLAERSIHFRNFFEETWEGSTSDGEFISMQSLLPLDAGSVATRYPRNNYRALPAVLRDAGYSTLSAHAFYGALYRMSEVHPRYGFERSLFRKDFDLTEELGLGLADVPFLQQAVTRVDSLRRPFMTLFITLSSHHPFSLPEKYRRLDLSSLPKKSRLGGYLQSVHYADSALGVFIGELEKRKLLDSSVVVIYGDHRGELNDDYGRLASLLFGADTVPGGTFDVRLWRARYGVPLIIHLPGDQLAGRRTVSGGQADIMPTVLGLLGVRDSTLTTLGRDLLQGENSLVPQRSGSFILGDTTCVASDPRLPGAGCWIASTRKAIEPTLLQNLFDDVRNRITVSDAIIRGDLIVRR